MLRIFPKFFAWGAILRLESSNFLQMISWQLSCISHLKKVLRTTVESKDFSKTYRSDPVVLLGPRSQLICTSRLPSCKKALTDRGYPYFIIFDVVFSTPNWQYNWWKKYSKWPIQLKKDDKSHKMYFTGLFRLFRLLLGTVLRFDQISTRADQFFEGWPSCFKAIIRRLRWVQSFFFP